MSLQALKKPPANSSHYDKKLNGKGPATNKPRAGDVPSRSTVEKGNQRKADSTVFKVSLPLTEGSVLLQRTSFSRDRVPLSTVYEPPPSESTLDPWPEMEEHSEDSELEEHSEDLELEEQCSSFGSQAGEEDPSGEDAEGNQEVDGDFAQAVQPDSLRVANVLSSLGNDGSSDDGSEEGQDWRITRTVWLDEPPQTQSWSEGAGGPLPRSPSEPADDELWRRLESGGGGGPAAGMSSGRSLESTSSQALSYYQPHQLQYRYMALGGAVVQHGGRCCSGTNSINAPLPFGGPLAAMGGTAAEPQPADGSHPWRSVMSCMPFGPNQAAPQDHATAWCHTWGAGREMTPDQVGQRWAAPAAAQQHCHSHHTVMWTLR